MDRCLPSYSIKVLERIHHLFDGIDNITVIISVDSIQLKHSIQQIYGQDVNVDKYLKKFIDFTVILDKGELNSNFQDKYKKYFSYFLAIDKSNQKFFNELFSNIFNGIDIRTQEKLINRAMLIHEILYNNEKLNPALLCFEIMWIAITYRNNNNNNLYWVPKINRATYLGLKDTIGEKLENYLQNLEKAVGSSGNVQYIRNQQFKIIDDNLIRKAQFDICRQNTT